MNNSKGDRHYSLHGLWVCNSFGWTVVHSGKWAVGRGAVMGGKLVSQARESEEGARGRGIGIKMIFVKYYLLQRKGPESRCKTLRPDVTCDRHEPRERWYY